jgi:protein SCO1/2
MKKAILLLLLVAVVAGCSPKKEVGPADKPLSEAGEKLYDLKGKIVARDPEANSLTIDHEAIPGFMEAMKMDYTVRGAKVARLPANGARIAAKLHVTDGGFWITDVQSAP